MPIRCVARWTSGIRRSGLAGMRFARNYAFSVCFQQGIRLRSGVNTTLSTFCPLVPAVYRHLTFRLPSYWKMEKISMSFRTRATIAAFIVFALVSVARAQAPVQTSTQATALPPDDEFYSLREPAAAGNAQPQFALGNHYFYGLAFPKTTARLCSDITSPLTRASPLHRIYWATCINISSVCRGITSAPWLTIVPRRS